MVDSVQCPVVQSSARAAMLHYKNHRAVVASGTWGEHEAKRKRWPKRLILNSTYMRAVTSPTVTVQ